MFASLLAAVLLTAAPGPLDVVKSGNTDVQKVASAKGATADQLSKVVEKFVDFGELSKRALGDKWDKLTAAQRKDFSARICRKALQLCEGRRDDGLVQFGSRLASGPRPAKLTRATA